MNKENLLKIIEKGENIFTEFKESKTELNKNVFDSICAFLNRSGGNLFLGVKDNGKICGIEKDKIEKIKQDLVTSLNNPKKLYPTYFLIPKEIEYNGKTILHLNVPESSQVHHHKNKIFDRNEDGDFNISNNSGLVSAMYLRKQTSYSENTIYPYVEMKDLRTDLIKRAKKLALNQRPGHIWNEMSDFEMLKSAQLYLSDYQTGKEGFTLAGILLFGKDEVILSVLPHHKTDAILRKKDLNRYDDRDDIRTNLIESYDRLMAFIAKHLSDKFYLEKDQRISLRDHIFREVVSNILIHREFISPFPAKLIISPDKVTTENSNKPHGFGLLNLNNYSPFPKNPSISRVFREIGRADELGSGMRNIYYYCNKYSGKSPKLLEENIFKIIINIPSENMTVNKETVEGLNEGLNEGLKSLFNKIIKNEGAKAKELSVLLNNRPIKTIDRQIRNLKEMGIIERKGSRKTGGYYLTKNDKIFEKKKK